jgi:manganese transport protein
MAGGTIFTGMFGKAYDVKSRHTFAGVAITLVGGLLCVFAVKDTFSALIISQMLLSIQLPITVCLQIYLTSSKKVMGAYANSRFDIISLWLIAGIVIVLNIMLLGSALQ